ncbi:ChaN family lipoprotein [Halomonas shantousis]
MQRRDCLKTVAALGMLLACPAWATEHTRRMRAIGRVRDLHLQRWLDSAELLERLQAASAVIVGERHDNPEHHRLERWIVTQLAEHRRLGGVAMEMLDASQQARLAIPPVQLASMSDDALASALDWNRGWDWSAYGPLVRNVLVRDVPLAAANLPASAVRDIVATDQAPELPPAVVDAQRHALVEGHCGMLPEAMLDGMLAAQVARDRAMAQALDALPATALLICGSGHARRDLGVARYLGAPVLTIGLVEVPPDVDDWRDALPRSVDQGPPFDLAWFTRAHPRGDMCATLRRRFASSASDQSL